MKTPFPFILKSLFAAGLFLFSMTLHTGFAHSANPDFRQWMASMHRIDYPRHGCNSQASLLPRIRGMGGAVIPLAKNRFFIAWFPPGWEKQSRRRLVVTLHGNGGCAERMFTFWHRTAALHGYAIIAVQYAQEDENGRLSYDDSPALYALLEKTVNLLRRHCPLQGVTIILHGFSRGAARVYELAAMDRAPGGMRAFSAFIADSGAVFAEYRGRLSPYLERLGLDAYDGARFWLYCGGRDHEGRTCRGIEKISWFIRRHGAVVDAVYRHPPGGHGIFLTGGVHRRSKPLEALFSYINRLSP